MFRLLLRPRWLAWHLTLVVVLIAFGALGLWQWESYRDSGPSSRAQATPTPVSAVTAPGGRLAGSDLGRLVTARGTYEPAGQLAVPGRRAGGREGFVLVTPLRTAAGIVAVTRGWVPSPDVVAARVPAGEVRVTGVLAPSESPGDSRVDPVAPLPPGQIPYIATVQVLDALTYAPDELYDGQLVLTTQTPPTPPSPQPVEATWSEGGVGAWRNLAYALQWWLFAGAAIFFWWSVLHRAATEPSRRESEDKVPVRP